MNVKLVAKTKPIDGMSIEEYIVNCARVSNPDNRLNHETGPKLLKYLIEHKHWSPFEMVNFGFEIQTSRAIAQQLLRHRSFSFQEFSQRYSEVTEIEPVQLRMKTGKNRQSSSEECKDDDLISTYEYAIHKSKSVYKELVDSGVSTECARMVLPLATQTTIIMNGTLRSWIHFLEQRTSDHAQEEIRFIAYDIEDILSSQLRFTSMVLGWNDR